MNQFRKHRTRHTGADELNITAFMNLMVALVPFLLITAVFSRLTVLELNLPGSESVANPDQPPEFQL
jgi:biopolymer transport protein ExbD